LQSSVGARAFQKSRLQKQFKKQAEILLPAAIAAYRQGNPSGAQALCMQILKNLPHHFDALHLLGVSQSDCRQFEEAERTLARAVSVDPRSAEAHSNLGLALLELKRYDDARKCQERAVALRSNFPTALTNLGNVLMRLELIEQAVDAHNRAIQLKPDYADAYCNRGTALLLLNRNDEAGQSFDRALSFQRDHLQATLGKALVSFNRRNYDAAKTTFDALLASRSDVALVWAHRGRLSIEIGQIAQAKVDFDAAVAIDPLLETAWLGKAQIGILTGNVMGAIAACMKAIEQNPASALAIMLLGVCHRLQGDIVTSIEHFNRALAIKPDLEEAITAKIFTLDFAHDADFAVHQAARRVWWDAIGAKLPRAEPQRRIPDPNKRIVVGYVSSDFKSHSVAWAFMPVLRNHDRRDFEIVCYSCGTLQDAVTEECRSLADNWVDASRFSDDQLSCRIQSDGVDILVDLSGHTAGNRLAVFARKPAPIQVSAWGHPTGTGLPTMDYLFADPVLIPQAARHTLAETIYDLPCVTTTEALIAQSSALPMIRNGHITFGVFNRIDKISDEALVVWSKLLQQVAGSTIVIKNGALDDPFLRDRLIGRFVAHGISQDRVKCIGLTSRPEHIAEFANIDISLDPFPQNGGVSTWESLQAGVPVVTKLGNTVSSRVGGAIVKAVGLDDWVADDNDGYIAIARTHASMVSQLEALRASLPAGVAASEAGNGAIYARRVEQGYRRFWRDYCARLRSPLAR
jgi:predicted O-linked N-acetylglucosamine transferase (SPINDLY family)